MDAITEARWRRNQLLDDLKGMLDRADRERRTLTRRENARYRDLEGELEQTSEEIGRLEEERRIELARTGMVDEIDPRVARGPIGYGWPFECDRHATGSHATGSGSKCCAKRPHLGFTRL